MKKCGGLVAVAAVMFGQVTAQAGFSALPYSIIQPANHSCVLQAKLPSCPEQNPMQVGFETMYRHDQGKADQVVVEPGRFLLCRDIWYAQCETQLVTPT